MRNQISVEHNIVDKCPSAKLPTPQVPANLKPHTPWQRHLRRQLWPTQTHCLMQHCLFRPPPSFYPFLPPSQPAHSSTCSPRP